MHAAPAAVLPFWLDRPPAEALEVAAHADRLGFHELWVGEMLHFDAFALAGALAPRTRLTLCVGPVAAGARDPVSLARGIASVAVLGDRPARLALGASTPAVVSGWHGREWGGEPERMREVAGAVRGLLAGERVRAGYRSALGPQPAHLTIAAFGRRMLEVASTEADRVVLNLVTVEQVAAVKELLGRLAAARGHPEPLLAVWLVAAVEPSAAARGQVAAQLSLYLRAPGYRDAFRLAGFGDLVDTAMEGAPVRELAGRIPAEMIERLTAWGSAGDVLERVAAYRQVGAEPAIVPSTAGDPGGRRVLELIASG